MAVWTKLRHQLVHPFCGLVNDLIELQANPGDPDLHFYAAQLPDLIDWVGFSFVERSSAAGQRRDEAIAATLGEAVERYAAAVALHETEDLVIAPWSQLGSAAVDPRRFALYAPEQYAGPWPFPPPRPEDRLRWVRGHSLTRGCDVLIPAQFVYLPYRPISGEPLLGLHTSTGTACGQTVEQATLSGLCEVIERDAFMIHWLGRLPARRAALEEVPALFAEVRSRYQRPGITYHVFDFTTDIGVPSYFVAVVDDAASNTAMAVGAAARPSSAAAVRKAMMESVQTRVWLRQMARSEGLRPFADFADIHSFEDHVHLWGHRDMLPHAKFLLDQTVSVPLQEPCPKSDVAGQVNWVVDRLAARGLEAIIVDITPEDIRSIGLTVVRAVVPGAVPLSSDHRYEPLGGERLYTVPAALGYPPPQALTDFNPVPHPFP